MADDATPNAPTDAPASVTVTEADKTAPIEDEATVSKQNGDAAAESDEKQDAATNGDKSHDAVDSAEAGSASGGKDKKRKSIGGVPEHKAKKLNKKKSMATLHLGCEPGQYYWARLKGYPPWPSIICDEAMLPESLLATRPVSTARPDGSIRDDFKEGGKNAKERTFPIMFLATNEFQWMVNTNLTPLDPEECTKPPAKMTKALHEAWNIASENHDLQHFKDILSAWQEEEESLRKQDEEAQAEAERAAAEKAAKAEQASKDEAGKPKKKARKSKAADEDVEMADAETPKSSKKRKKDATDSDVDSAKPKKTPKVTKLNAPKTPGEESSASTSKKTSSKPKKKVVQAPKQEEEDEAKPQLSDEERLQQREKAVLYLRHRLQKGFLARDQAPQDSEMPGMADFFTQLEAYENLEPAIIRNTKIHKVLKAIMKLATVPKDDEYHFKKRSSDLLELWNKSMEADGGEAPPSAVEQKQPETNGDSSKASASAEDKNGEETKEGAEDEEKKAKENADQIEQKVEGKKDAIADDPPAPAEDAVDEASSEAKNDTTADSEMKNVSAEA